MKVQNINPYVSQKRNNVKPSFKRSWAEHVSWGANYIKETGTTNFKLFSFPDAKVFVEVGRAVKETFGSIKERIVTVVGAAGAALTVEKLIPQDEKTQIYPMENKGDGIFEAKGIDAKPGTDYRFIVADKQNHLNLVKDPYTKIQKDINGWSTVYDKDNYKWKNTDWLDGKDPRRIIRKPDEAMRGLEKLVIDEVNIPTLTEEGTFESAKKRIDVIAERGVATAIELMPVENTFSKQWGYDGVDKFAANEKLGGAKGLKELIDYAHGKGLNVIIDMVPNHMGPDGDYLAQTGPYIRGAGDFGNLFNYEGSNNKYVRDFMSNVALWWANEYKVDGLRLDLTKACKSDYLLRQIVLEVNEHNPNVFLIAEDHENKRHKITSYYINNTTPHEDKINSIDENVEKIRKGLSNDGPWSIGFDSEWDSNYKETLVDMVRYPNPSNLDKFENNIKSSHYRIKYAYSHDEIGNEDGTRFIPKSLVQELGLYFNVGGGSDSQKGQRAAHISQKLAELIVSEKFESVSDEELANIEKEMGITCFYSKETLLNAFQTAFAKQKLLQGTVFTTPGPKMYFQGDDEADLSYFKFYREFSNEKIDRQKNPEEINKIIHNKGYDTLEEIARPDSIIGRVKPSGLLKDVRNNMIHFMQDLAQLAEKHPALIKGEIVSTYKDNGHNVHIHELKNKDEDFLVIKNFGVGFHENSYNYYGFPQEGVWKEVFNSDNQKYGGSNYINSSRDDITNLNQNLSLAPNSIIILQKIK